MFLSGFLATKLSKKIKFPFSKRDLALIEGVEGESSTSDSKNLKGKSGLRSIGVMGPGEEAILNLLQSNRKINSVVPVRG